MTIEIGFALRRLVLRIAGVDARRTGLETVVAFAPEVVALVFRGSVIVPESGVDEERVGGDVARARVLRATTIYDREKMLIWKDEGNAYQQEDLFGEAVTKGEAAAYRKCVELGSVELATESVCALLRSLAVACGVPVDRLVIEVYDPVGPLTDAPARRPERPVTRPA